MVETLVALGVLGCFPAWQHHGKLHGNTHRINHLVLGSTGVYVQALEGDLGTGGIEVFKLQLAHGATVHRVSPVTGEFLHVEVVGTQANFLVGVEAHADVAVLHLAVLLQPFHGAQYFGDTSLVVGAEQGVTTGDDELLTYVIIHFGELLRVKRDVVLFIQHDGFAVIFDDAWFHVVAAHVGGGVHVGNKADGGHILIGIGGQCGK